MNRYNLRKRGTPPDYSPALNKKSKVIDPPEDTDTESEEEVDFIEDDTTGIGDEWKKDLPTEEVKRLEPLLNEIQTMISDEEPTVPKILNARLTPSEKKDAIELYTIYSGTDPDSTDRLIIKKKLIEIISCNKDISDEELRLMSEKSQPQTTLSKLKTAIASLVAKPDIKEKLLHIHSQLIEYGDESDTYRTLKDKLEWYVSLPYDKCTTLSVQPQDIGTFCKNLYERLDSSLYGLQNIKQELVTIVHKKLCNPATRCSIGFKGPAGVGKTSVAKALADALNLPFERIPLGGMEDSTIFKGSAGHWLGAGPSIILRILARMKTSDGIIHFDEIDKLGSSPKGREIVYALLHITDYTQNSEFRDIYLDEIPHDISRIWFTYAMNDDSLLDPLLHDRLHILEIQPYTNSDLMVMMPKYLVPRISKDVGIDTGVFTIDESGYRSIISTCENRGDCSGVRTIERLLSILLSRVNLLRSLSVSGTSINLSYSVDGIKFPLVINSDTVRKVLHEEKCTETFGMMYV